MADGVYGLNKFLQKLRTTGLRLGYQFQVTIAELDDLQFYATATNLPGKTLTANEVPYFGITFRTPGAVDYGGEWTISARVDNDLTLKTQLDEWISKFADLKKNGGGDKRLTESLIKIDLLDSSLEKITHTFTMVGVFPTEMGALELDLSSGEIVSMDINIAFQYWFEGEKDPLG
jgi:hypothetical protein